jgi:hypothetical protein
MLMTPRQQNSFNHRQSVGQCEHRPRRCHDDQGEQKELRERARALPPVVSFAQETKRAQAHRSRRFQLDPPFFCAEMRPLLGRWDQQEQADHSATGGTEKVEVKERALKMINEAAN